MLKRSIEAILRLKSKIGASWFAPLHDTPTDWTFKDLVRDPKLAQRVMAERDIDPDKVTDEDIHHIIDGLCHEGIRNNCAHWIKELGIRAKAVAISRINDPSLLEAEDGAFTFPLRELVPTVTGRSDPDVIARLRELAEDSRSHVRQLAGQVLAGAGMAEDAALLVRLIHDDDQRVRDSVLFGLKLYYYKDREHTPAIVDALYPELLALIGKKHFMVEFPAETLMRLDKQRATADLSKPELWAHDAPEGNEVVNAFLKIKLPPPIDALEDRVKSLTNQSENEVGAYGYARALNLLAKHDLNRAKPFLETASNHSDRSVRRLGRESQCRIAGIHAPYDKLSELSGRDENIEMDSYQAIIASVCAIDGEVGNGGFEQYLWNSTADQWPEHRDSLCEVKADEHLTILDRVTQLFGTAGPPTDRNQRHKPLAKVARKHEQTLDEANSNWYSLDETLDQRVIEYALKHPDSFRPEPPPA